MHRAAAQDAHACMRAHMRFRGWGINCLIHRLHACVARAASSDCKRVAHAHRAPPTCLRSAGSGRSMQAHAAAAAACCCSMAGSSTHRGHDEEAVEDVLADLTARQTNGQTTDTSDGEHRGHCTQAGGRACTHSHACSVSEGASELMDGGREISRSDARRQVRLVV